MSSPTADQVALETNGIEAAESAGHRARREDLQHPDAGPRRRIARQPPRDRGAARRVVGRRRRCCSRRSSASVLAPPARADPTRPVRDADRRRAHRVDRPARHRRGGGDGARRSAIRRAGALPLTGPEALSAADVDRADLAGHAAATIALLQPTARHVAGRAASRAGWIRGSPTRPCHLYEAVARGALADVSPDGRAGARAAAASDRRLVTRRVGCRCLRE